jgi:hypothetical protein
MAQIPAISNLRTEDFPGQEKWISRLFFPLNQFLETVTNAINGNITHGDNIPCQTQQLLFVYGAITDFPKIFKWTLPVAPVEIRVCSATENGTAIAMAVAWSYSAGTVTISQLLKLTSTGVVPMTSGATYNVVLRGLT